MDMQENVCIPRGTNLSLISVHTLSEMISGENFTSTIKTLKFETISFFMVFTPS